MTSSEASLPINPGKYTIGCTIKRPLSLSALLTTLERAITKGRSGERRKLSQWGRGLRSWSQGIRYNIRTKVGFSYVFQDWPDCRLIPEGADPENRWWMHPTGVCKETDCFFSAHPEG